MTVPELVESVLLARGSSQDEPRRTQLSGAVVRAAVEAERSMSEPRLLVRRDGDCVLVAQDASLAGYARRLGEIADQLADEDPLVAPARVVERLREIGSPAEANLSDARLVRLASAVSQHAALSSRQELYPRGMPAARAVRLSQGALGGLRMLTVAQVRERVAGRYPEAAPLPDRPALDDLLREAGFDFRWEESGKDGAGCYVSNLRDVVSVTSGSATFYDRHTSDVQYAARRDHARAGGETGVRGEARTGTEGRGVPRTDRADAWLPSGDRQAHTQVPLGTRGLRGPIPGRPDGRRRQGGCQLGPGPQDRCRSPRRRLGQADDPRGAGDADCGGVSSVVSCPLSVVSRLL